MIVVKLGGAALKQSLTDPLLFSVLASSREPIVIVHGGGPEINQTCERLGLVFDFVDGQRVTSPAVMDVVEMVLSGKVNPAIVRGLLAAGRPAVGLSGVDGALLKCEPENPKLGQVGRVTQVAASLLTTLTAQGFVPVVSPVGLFSDGKPCNVNADLAAAQIAVALKASQLLFLTDRDGILDAEGGTMAELSAAKLRELAASNVVSGGMKVKARAILEVLDEVSSCRVGVMNGLDAVALGSALAGHAVGTRIK